MFRGHWRRKGRGGGGGGGKGEILNTPNSSDEQMKYHPKILSGQVMAFRFNDCLW